MMAIQNYGFFMMYFLLLLMIQLSPATPPGVTVPNSMDVSTNCSNMRFWIGFFALDCFLESFCVLWMAMGGYIGSTCMFAFGWVLHLVVALPYCISSVGIPYVIYNNGGQECRASMGPAGLVVEPVVWVHVGLFMVYVWMMLSITYYSFVKPTFFKSKTAKVDVS